MESNIGVYKHISIYISPPVDLHEGSSQVLLKTCYVDLIELACEKDLAE